MIFLPEDIDSFQKVFNLENQVLAICAIRKGYLIKVQIPLHNLGEALPGGCDQVGGLDSSIWYG